MIFLSATHLSQPTSTLFRTLFIYAALRVEESATAAHWWILGRLALVATVFTRAQIGISLALPFMVRILWLMRKGTLRREWARPRWR